MAITLHSNNAVAKLLNPVAVPDTTIVLQSGQGALFPAVVPLDDAQFWVTVEDRSLGKLEVMLCTSRAGDSLTVVRAQQGTTAQVFAIATTSVANRLTAEFLNTFDARIDEALLNSEGAAAAAGSAVVIANDAHNIAQQALDEVQIITGGNLTEIQETADEALATANTANATATTALAAAGSAESAAASAVSTAGGAASVAADAQADADSAVVAAAAATAAVAGKVDTTDPRLSDPRTVAAGNYVAVTVDGAGNFELVIPELVDSILGTDATQAEAVFDHLAASATAIPTSATFRDWRDGTSLVKLMTPVTFKALTTPQVVAYTPTITLDFGDASGSDPDLGKARSLNFDISAVTGDCAVSFAGFTGTLIGQEVCLHFTSGSSGAKALSVVAGSGQTLKTLNNHTSPGLGATGTETYAWVRFSSTTSLVLVAWGAAA